ncbi:MAG: hypothetical protein VYE22_36305 [Myxococcota bacterium]|nr:hypothetical protein [Myxococcota bacterium]
MNLFGKRRCARCFSWFSSAKRKDATLCPECEAAEARARAQRAAALAEKREAWRREVAERIRSDAWTKLAVGGEVQTVARVGGAPVGVDASRWPSRAGVPAMHLCTFGAGMAGGAPVAVFLHRERDGDSLLPTGDCAIVEVRDGDATVDPSDTLPSCGLTPAELGDWDPTDPAQSRSFVGTVALAYDGRSLRERFEGGVVDLESLGALRAQIDGADLPWRQAEPYCEISGIYLFERGALIDLYG